MVVLVQEEEEELSAQQELQWHLGSKAQGRQHSPCCGAGCPAFSKAILGTFVNLPASGAALQNMKIWFISDTGAREDLGSARHQGSQL